MEHIFSVLKDSNLNSEFYIEWKYLQDLIWNKYILNY